MSEFVISGHKLTVIDGPQSTVQTFASHEEAVAKAAELELLDIEKRKHRLARMAKYASPDHPADPVILPAETIEALTADLDRAENPVDPPHRGLPVVKSGSLTVEQRAAIAASAEAAEAAEVVEADPPPSTPNAPAIAVGFVYDAEKGRVKVVFTSNSGESITVGRTIGEKTGETKVEPGREMSRTYNLKTGETIDLAVGDLLLDSFTAP